MVRGYDSLLCNSSSLTGRCQSVESSGSADTKVYISHGAEWKRRCSLPPRQQRNSDSPNPVADLRGLIEMEFERNHNRGRTDLSLQVRFCPMIKADAEFPPNHSQATIRLCAVRSSIMVRHQTLAIADYVALPKAFIIAS